MVDIKKITEFIENKVRNLGYEPEEISIKYLGNQILVKVIIDRTDRFISVGDCSYVSKNIENYLEQEIPGRFTIEVSSPGADRELKKDSDFERFKGMHVELFMKDGRRITGKLMAKIEGKIYIIPHNNKKGKKTQGTKENKILDFPVDMVKKVKLCPIIF
ncbi:MAG: hypothetical protein RMJ45_07535 [Candidatus Calescibacterium sp.]|nr:hypothetical protein [Candidatus Calescibacterium sp.]